MGFYSNNKKSSLIILLCHLYRLYFNSCLYEALHGVNCSLCFLTDNKTFFFYLNNIVFVIARKKMLNQSPKFPVIVHN